MRKGPFREFGRGLAPIIAGLVLFLLAGGAAAAGPGRDGSREGRPSERKIVLDSSPGSRAVEPILARLWDSGFFRQNDAVRLELLNNNYAFFGPGSPVPPKGTRGLGCYSRKPGQKDTIFLQKDLFARFEIGPEGLAAPVDMSRRILPVLLHEICHDLWMNILDERERAAFAREGSELMEQYCMAQTDEGQRLFQLRFGDDIADPRCRRSYSEIDRILAARLPRPLGAHELFPWLAERLFMTKAMIPKPLRKYYSCILAGVAATETETLR